METSNERDSQERRVGPTVSKDKWVNHARAKMSRGYVLIIGTKRRTANFYSKEKGYEMCAYNVAKQMVKEGVVAKTGDHHLGDVYELVMAPQEEVEPMRRQVDDESGDDLDLLLDDLDQEAPDAHDESAAAAF